MRTRLGIALAITASVVAATAVSNSAASAKPPARSAPTFLEPVPFAAACRMDARRAAGCSVVSDFFRATNSRRFETACSLLGERLRADTHGLTCPSFLAAGVPEPVPWGIHGARLTGHRVAILVAVGVSELDRTRMLLHRAVVGLEGGRLKILDTRIVGELG